MSTQIWIFVIAAAALVATPGPDMVYIASHSILHGRASGFMSTVGVCMGYIVHTILAATGLSVLLQSSALTFTFIRYAGATYLLWLGVRTLCSHHTLFIKQLRPTAQWTILCRGVVTSVLNPKGILFFVAFLPQFVTPTPGMMTLQLVGLGMGFTLLTVLIYGTVALVSGSVRAQFAQSPRALRWLSRVSGSVLLALGVRLLLPAQR